VIETAPALSVPGGTIVPVAPISAAAPFVGRARELARLERLLEQAVAGSAAGVLLAGDAGVGKTRLVTELLSRARAAGAVAVLGHCVDLGAGGLPYLPFAEALTETVRAGEAPGAPTHVAEAAAAVRAMARQRPVLRRLTGDVEGAGRDEGPERMPLYEAVLEALHAVTDGVAPVLLVLEDLHWADASTRDLLRFVLARLSDERLLVVGTYRSDDLHRRHPLRPLLGELVRLPRVERVDVAPFDAGELGEYLRALRGGELPAPLVADIRTRSEGNAYYAEELLAAADAAAAPPIDPTGDPTGAGRARVALPEQLADVLLARLERLAPAVQQVARVASVAGRRVPDTLLRAALDLPAAEIEEALREAVTHHVLVADGADRYAFRHALLQEAVYGDLLPGERVRLHTAYARLLADHGDDTAADLARHCLAAHDLPGALAASLRAAERATAVLAPAEALGHLEQALQLVDAVPGDQRPAGAEPLQLTLRAAAAAGAAGELHRAASLARAAVAGAARGGDPALEAAARADLAKRLYEVDADVEALAEIAKVRSLLAGTGPSPTRVWAVALEAQLTHHDSIDGTRGLVEPALAEARALGLPAAEADLLLTLAVREGAVGDVEVAARRLAEAQRLATEAADPLVALRAVYNLGINRMDSGDLEGARATLEQGLAEAERAGQALTVYGVDVLFMLLQTLLLAGEWDEALALEARARVRVPEVQRDQLRGVVLAARVARDPLAALPLTQELVPVAHAHPWWGHMILVPRADALRWVGDHDGAVRVIRECLQIKDESGSGFELSRLAVTGVGLGALAGAAAEAAARDDTTTLAALRAEGDALLAQAREVARRGRPRLGSLGPEGRAWLARGEAEHARLHGRDTPDDWRRAVEAFGFGQRYEVARSRRHLAEALVAAGDREGAAREAVLARDEAVALLARPLREAVDALARRARLDLGAGPATASVLTPREQEVMRLVARGLTNRQIGRQLFISEKTASVHVSNVLAKLGAGGRAEAVAIAHRRGLIADPESTNDRDGAVRGSGG
jgi:DNA-binding CsgD family transcriptional regulator